MLEKALKGTTGDLAVVLNRILECQEEQIEILKDIRAELTINAENDEISQSEEETGSSD